MASFTYLLVNLVFLACILVLLAPSIKKPSKAWWLMFAVLMLLTAVFDSLIVWAGIVGYDASKILGIYVGFAPIEDFFYAILAACIVPLFWKRFDAQNKSGVSKP